MKWWRNSYTIIALGVFWGLTALWGIGQMRSSRQNDILLQNKYNRAFVEAAQRTKNVETLLSKGLVTASPQQMNTILSDLWFNASAAQDNLHQLPISHQVVAQTSKFLTQVGDYAYSLTKRENNKSLNEQDRKMFSQLYQKAKAVNGQMATVVQQASSGRFHWSEVSGGLNRNLSRGSLSAADNSFRRVDNQLQEVPTMVYDGPFSDHIDKRAPLGLTGKEITSTQARYIAHRFVDWKGSTPRQTRMGANIRGRIPAYSIEYVMGNKNWEVITVNVSKKGGHLIYMINPRQVTRISLTDAQALKMAQSYLAAHGLTSMIPSYTLRHQNVLTITFVSKQGDTVIYPDQIKVDVALDNGQVLGLEALGYLTAHHTRSLPQPSLTMDQARAKVNPKLKIESGRKALIPTSASQEVLTYEFKTKLGSDTFLVYINAKTGNEENILKLINLPNGTLSM